jgi:hypothetical protein
VANNRWPMTARIDFGRIAYRAKQPHLGTEMGTFRQVYGRKRVPITPKKMAMTASVNCYANLTSV